MRKAFATSSLALACALITASGSVADTHGTPAPGSPAPHQDSHVAPTSNAAPSAAPSAAPVHHDTPSPTHTRNNAAIKAANDAYAAAVAAAQSSFDRAVADAAAVRDQEILATPTDKVAVKAARDAYKAAFTQLKQLFQANIAASKQARDAVIAAAK